MGSMASAKVVVLPMIDKASEDEPTVVKPVATVIADSAAASGAAVPAASEMTPAEPEIIPTVSLTTVFRHLLAKITRERIIHQPRLRRCRRWGRAAVERARRRSPSMSATPPMNYLVPMVIEQTNRGERSFDLYSRLLKDRIIFLGTPITDEISNVIMAQLIHLEGEDPGKDINLYINSPGGSVTSALAIYDTIEFIKPDVTTICMGQAASAAAILLAAGTKGKRFALPHARILIHQPHGGAEGQSSDIEIQAREIQRIRDLLDQILADKTGQDLAKITTDTDRDFIMTAQEAVEYGIIDQVLQSRRLQEVQLAAS